jgi:hypothetical protein
MLERRNGHVLVGTHVCAGKGPNGIAGNVALFSENSKEIHEAGAPHQYLVPHPMQLPTKDAEELKKECQEVTHGNVKMELRIHGHLLRLTCPPDSFLG